MDFCDFSKHEIVVGGFQKFSAIEYPGKLCSVIFTRGCNFRCKYCYNPELVFPEVYADFLNLQEIYKFLESRKNKIDAVVITGGEPTLYGEKLVETIKNIKQMGFLVKIDSNGSNPDVLDYLIQQNLIDYISVDIKTALEKYFCVIGLSITSFKDYKIEYNVKRSIEIILNSGIDHEFRTTIVKPIIEMEDIINIANEIKGARRYYIQKFISSKKILNMNFTKISNYHESDLTKLSQDLVEFGYVDLCEVR